MEDEMGRACSTNGEKTNAYGMLVGKPEERPGRWWIGNIKMGLRQDGMV
jgi:hypothetical protein